MPRGIGGGLLPSFADSSDQLLVWQEPDNERPFTNAKFVFSALVSGDSVAAPDTVGVTNLNGRIHMGVRTARAEWVFVSDDSTNPDTGVYDTLIRIRVRVAGTSQWIEFARDSSQWGSPEVYQNAFPASESTVVVVLGRWTFPNRGNYVGVLSTTGWLVRPMRIHAGGLPQIPQLRPGPDNVVTLAHCASDSLAYVSRYQDGSWSISDTLRWNLQGPAPHNARIVSVSEDGRRLPVVGATIYDRFGVERVYVSVPGENGYGVGEYIPDTELGGSTIVQRDENGDVWAAWWRFGAGFYYIMSVPRATCAAPTLSDADGHPRITWTLTEPVLESAWVVERSADGSAFAAVGRVIAQSETTLSFVDTLAPDNATLRYRIHRPHRDVRRTWTSEVSEEWLPTHTRIGVRLASANPVTSDLVAEATGIRAGSIELQLLDLQGRVVHRVRQPASGLGRDLLRVRLADVPRLRSGLYLLRVTSGAARASSSVKVAVIR